jgi:hypothetical protein
MLHPFETREISAWVESARIDRAMRVLSDPRLRPTRVGSDDARVRRQLAERFAAEAFDDLRRLAVVTPVALWVDRSAPLAEREREALANEDIAIVAGACALPFLLAVPQCETAPSFRRMHTGRALLGVCEAFGKVEVFQASVAMQHGHQLSEGLRVAAAAALAVLGPIDQVTAFGVREGTMTASVVGQRGLGTLAVGAGVEATSFTLIGDGGLATVASGLVAWRRRDGTWVEETHLPVDGDEPTIQTILEAEKPSGATGSASSLDDAHRRMRLRIAALADTLRLSARTAHSESVEAMLRGFGVDPIELLPDG